MNAIKLLKEDHEKLKDLMAKLEDATAPQKKKLFEEIKANASVHEKAEEKFLYPHLAKKKEFAEHAAEHTEEVKIMSKLLKEIPDLAPSSVEWKAKCSVLKELTEHHIDEEEDEFFGELESILSEEELEEIGEQITQYKHTELSKKGFATD